MEPLMLKACLRRVRRRLLLISSASGIFWGLLVVTAILLVAVWFDLIWEISPQARVTSLVSSAMGGLLLVGFSCWATWRISRDSAVARRLDRAAESGGAIVSGWDLHMTRLGRADDFPHDVTDGLAGIAVGRAAQLAADTPTSRAVSARPLRNSIVVLALALAVVALLAFCLPSLASTEWKRFANPFADTPPYSLLKFDVTPGDTDVVYGRSLDVRAELRGAPVERVELVFQNSSDHEPETLPMFPEAGGKWRAALFGIVEPAIYYVTAEGARSERYRIGVLTVPKIESVRFRIRPPEYARDAIYEGPLPEDGVAGLPGTRVEIRARSNRPLSSGQVEISSDGETSVVMLKPTAQNSVEVVGEMVIAADGKFRLHLTDTAGQSSDETFGGTITLLHDERPFVRLIEPRTMSLATPKVRLPVTVAAEDDYGLARTQLFRSLNNSRPLPMDVSITSPPPRRVRETVYLPLSAYDVEPGDVITLFARVEDNNPAGAKGAESSVVTVRIISQEEFQRMARRRAGLQVLMSKYRQALRRMEKLTEEAKQLQKKLEQIDPADAKALEALRQELKRLSERLHAEAEEIDKAAKQLLPYDLDKNLMEKLTDLAKSLHAAGKSIGNSPSEPNLTSEKMAAQLDKLIEQLRRQQKELNQQAMEPLEHLAAIYPLLEDQSKFVELVLRQRDLATRLSNLKGRDKEDDPAIKVRMRDLEEEQRRNRMMLDQLLRDIETHAAQLPDDEVFNDLRDSALNFVNDVAASGAAEAMSEAEAALADFVGSRGYEYANEAAEILEMFLSQCQGVGEAGGQCLKFNPSLSQKLGNTIDQLLAEAGLGGTGMGQAGGGYSARRSTLNNIGLYGGLPAMGDSVSEASGFGEQGGSVLGGGGGRSNPDEASLVESEATRAATGAGMGKIPLRYKKRVGQYLQRVAEETAEQH